ncbi:agamous-like MADS-box protein AGL61 [Cocos nucifera]|uniref:Agamous-like MADS-box protein AGL61 n=1 Tax=Cocos nucifera TaxID=13894 RepID=A0A8K0IHZ4_COCNU|nr:agamous-like MADS-box protein AGL61 [Cocos nucifera]
MMGRHKIDIKKIPETQQRQVCFSKRRKGLFKKAADICAASRTCSIAIIVFSGAGNLFTFAHPSVEAISRRFLGNEVLIGQLSNKESENILGDDGDSYQEESDDSHDVSDAESDYGDKEDVHHKEDVMRKGNNTEDTLIQEVGKKKEEKEAREETQEMSEGDKFWWWNKPIDDLRLEELLELEKFIVELRDKVRDRANFLLAQQLSLCSWHHK